MLCMILIFVCLLLLSPRCTIYICIYLFFTFAFLATTICLSHLLSNNFFHYHNTYTNCLLFIQMWRLLDVYIAVGLFAYRIQTATYTLVYASSIEILCLFLVSYFFIAFASYRMANRCCQSLSWPSCQSYVNC